MNNVFVNRLLKTMIKLIKSLFLYFICFVSMLPILTCILFSLSNSSDFSSKALLETISQINIGNYNDAISQSNFLKSFLFSFIILIIVLSISTICSAMISFLIYRSDRKTKQLIQFSYVIVALIPTILIQIPIFQMMSKLHLINSIIGYSLILCGADIVSIYIFGKYYQKIPISVDKAAYLDGCNNYSLFFKIHIPLLKNAFITSGIIKSVYVYNEFYMANIYLLDKSKYPTVTTELYSFLGPHNTNYGIICASCVIAMLPVVILFIISQKKMYSGFSMQ